MMNNIDNNWMGQIVCLEMITRAFIAIIVVTCESHGNNNNIILMNDKNRLPKNCTCPLNDLSMGFGIERTQSIIINYKCNVLMWFCVNIDLLLNTRSNTCSNRLKRKIERHHRVCQILPFFVCNEKTPKLVIKFKFFGNFLFSSLHKQ